MRRGRRDARARDPAATRTEYRVSSSCARQRESVASARHFARDMCLSGFAQSAGSGFSFARDARET